MGNTSDMETLFIFISSVLPLKNKEIKKIPSDIKTAAVDKFQAEGDPNPLCNWILLVILLFLSSDPSI